MTRAEIQWRRLVLYDFTQFLLIFPSSRPWNFQVFLAGNLNISATLDFFKFQG
jgi:hypothetical protein